MRLLLGIDLGTSYFKVGLFDEHGALRGLARIAVASRTPAPRHCELPIPVFWELLRRGVSDALAQSGAAAADIVGISYSSQASTFVLLDAADAPLTPLIVWSDARAIVEEADAAFSRTERFRWSTGFEGFTPESAPVKWRWFQRHEPAIWRRMRRIMTISDYFTFALTGERVGDASTAAFLGVYDVARADWWPEALANFDLAASQLSVPLRPGGRWGRTTSGAPVLLGVPAGVPFAVGALDHHAAAIGSGLERFAELSISTGTVLAALALVERPEPKQGCYHGLHVDGRRFYRLAFDADGAGQLEAYRNRHAPELTIEQLLALAAAAREGRAASVHGPAVLDILERIALAQRRLVEQVAGSATGKTIVATGGGARSPLWLQIKADALGASIMTPASPERACLGAGVFAAVAAGLYRGLDEATAAMVHPGRTFVPQC